MRTTNLVRGNNQFPRKLGSYQVFDNRAACSNAWQPFWFFFPCGCYDKKYNRNEQHPENKGYSKEVCTSEEGNKTRSVKESRYHTVSWTWGQVTLPKCVSWKSIFYWLGQCLPSSCKICWGILIRLWVRKTSQIACVWYYPYYKQGQNLSLLSILSPPLHSFSPKFLHGYKQWVQ